MAINLAVGGGDYPLSPHDQFGHAIPLANLPDGVSTAPDGVFVILGGPELQIVWKDGAAYLRGVSQGVVPITIEVLSGNRPVPGLAWQELVFIAPSVVVSI